MPMKKRNYAQEWANFKSKPANVLAHRKRDAARRALDARGVDRAGKDIDHKIPLSLGGGNAPSNLRLKTPSANRTFKRNGPGGKPKK
jgi:5-methylcytosine-specific restriction endonuclease McrA